MVTTTSSRHSGLVDKHRKMLERNTAEAIKGKPPSTVIPTIYGFSRVTY